MRNGRIKCDRIPGLENISLKANLDRKYSLKHKTVLAAIVPDGLVAGYCPAANVIKDLEKLGPRLRSRVKSLPSDAVLEGDVGPTGPALNDASVRGHRRRQ
jgi:hypothetical protein